MDVHGCSVITAVTSQNTCKVTAIHPLDEDDVISQLDAVLSDVRVDAVKIGMLYSKEIARTVCEGLKGLGSPLVVDPVLVAGVGDHLYSEDLLDTLRHDIFPMATVITPNRGEAELLVGRKINMDDDLEEVCRELAAMGPESVILKGGHFDGRDVKDLLFKEDEMIEVSMPRLDRKVHGGGCTFSAFLACGLARGKDVKRSLLDAKRRIHDSIALSYPVGQGMFVINPMATMQKESMRYSVLVQLEQAARDFIEVPSLLCLESESSFLFALPNPQDYDEVCEVVVRHDDLKARPDNRTGASFGSGTHAAKRLLSINRMDMRTLSILETTMPNEMRMGSTVSELDIMTLDSNENTRKKIGMGEDVTSMLMSMKRLPDLVLADREGKTTVMVLGEDPSDVLRKVSLAFR
jgi:hydroxymethylpyrimidine/phosphomethylpyrimidine kinase